MLAGILEIRHGLQLNAGGYRSRGTYKCYQAARSQPLPLELWLPRGTQRAAGPVALQSIIVSGSTPNRQLGLMLGLMSQSGPVVATGQKDHAGLQCFFRDDDHRRSLAQLLAARCNPSPLGPSEHEPVCDGKEGQG